MECTVPNSFLLDEVRCGFMVPGAIKQAWAADLEVLAEIDRVCEKHHIEYFADWGTLLGAIRHGGFVPWDDDIDIVMKRADYEKFLKVASKDLPEGFHIQTNQNQKDFWLFMGKVVGRNHFCFEKEHLRRFHNFPYIASVDIFVLDYVYRDPDKEEERRILCKYLLGVADGIVEGTLTGEKKERSLQTAEELYGQKLKRIEDAEAMGRYLYGEVEKIFARVPKNESDTLTQLFPWGLKGSDRHFPKEYYDNPIRVPFEHTTIPVPRLYDSMLRKRYGDYMRLVKDAGAHDYPFFEGQKKNLLKVLDTPLPEFRLEPAKLHRTAWEQAYKQQSYKEMTRECVQELWRMQEELLEAKQELTAEQGMNLLQLSQQLAVDLGTLLEQIVEENARIIHLLEQYCEELYVLYEQMAAVADGLQTMEETADPCMGSRLRQLRDSITTELDANVYARRAVLFLPVLAKDWKGLQPLWRAAKEDASCDVYVVPLPYYYKDYDGSPKTVCSDALDFPEEVQALDYRLFTPEYLELLHPETVILQNPYDAWHPNVSVPEMFYSVNIRKYTDNLIYVPPFAVEDYTKESARAYLNMKYYVTMPGVVYADQVLVQSENMRGLYIEKLTEFAGEETRESWEQKVLTTGLPIMDQSQAAVPTAKQKKKLLYGISLGTYMEAHEAAREKIESNLQIFRNCEEQVEVTVCFFPEADNTLTDIKREAEKLIRILPNITILQYGHCLTEDFDAYYGDPMPIVTEFGQDKKPVMIQNIWIL